MVGRDQEDRGGADRAGTRQINGTDGRGEEGRVEWKQNYKKLGPDRERCNKGSLFLPSPV